MQLTGNSILIKPDNLPEKTRSGLLEVPKSSKEMLTDHGEIIQVGPECEIARVGMRVIYPRKSASVIVIDEKDYYFVKEYQIKYTE